MGKDEFGCRGRGGDKQIHLHVPNATQGYLGFTAVKRHGTSWKLR